MGDIIYGQPAYMGHIKTSWYLQVQGKGPNGNEIEYYIFFQQTLDYVYSTKM